MDELDKKLDELSVWIEANRDVTPARWEEIWPDIKSRLEQAFVDSGWRNHPQVSDGTIFEEWYKKDKGLLSGQEWYELFMKEFDQVPTHIETQRVPKALVIKAAKKASEVNESWNTDFPLSIRSLRGVKNNAD